MESRVDCPTAILVDLSEPPKPVTPRPPSRTTPHRKCKTPKTPNESYDEIKSIIKEKEASTKWNILVSLENLVPPSSTPRDNTVKQSEEKQSEDQITTTEVLEDYPILEQEKFDFDLSLESGSVGEEKHSKEDDDEEDEEEVFFGAMTFKEKCIAKSIETKPISLSPLTSTEMMLLHQDAAAVASSVKVNGTPMKSAKTTQNEHSSDLSPLLSLQGTKRKVKALDLTPPKLLYSSPKMEKKGDSNTDLSKTPRSLSPDERKFGKNKSQPLKRASSMRLPRSKGLGNKNGSPKASSNLPKPGKWIRQLSSGYGKNASHKEQASSNETTHLNRSLCSAGESKLSGLYPRVSSRGLVSPSKKESEASKHKPATGLMRKHSLLKGAITQPGLNRLQQKSVLTKNGKTPTGCLPRGPLKATAPMKSLSQQSEPSAQKEVAKPAPRPSLVTPKTVTAPRIQTYASQSTKTQTREIPKPKLALTPRKNSLSRASTDENILASVSKKRRSYLPSPGRSTSFNLSRSIHSSASSSRSAMDSPLSSDTSMNQSRYSCSSKTRSSYTTPTKQKNENIPRSIPRRSMLSPATHLASKLKPVKLGGQTWNN